MNKLNVGTDSYEINVDELLRPSIERHLTGTTKIDTKINLTQIPKNPISLKFSILLLRWYQKKISPILGDRCVFEPSCSHYCEYVIREIGLIKGIYLTIKRLNRCRPGNGGIDLPPIKGDKQWNIK